MLSLCLTGLLSDIIDVFDFAPGVREVLTMKNLVESWEGVTECEASIAL